MYTKKLVNPCNTPARKAAWETLKKELTGREIGELIGCSQKTVDVWRRKKKPLAIYPQTAEKLIELLDQFSPSHKDESAPVSEEAVPEVAEKNDRDTGAKGSCLYGPANRKAGSPDRFDQSGAQRYGFRQTRRNLSCHRGKNNLKKEEKNERSQSVPVP